MNKAGPSSSYLEENFDKDPGGACGFVLVEMNACHGFPRDGVGEEEVAEYPSHVAELSDLQTVHRGVTVCEYVLKRLHVDLVHLAQPV